MFTLTFVNFPIFRDSRKINYLLKSRKQKKIEMKNGSI